MLKTQNLTNKYESKYFRKQNFWCLLIQRNQCNTDKENLEKKIRDVDNKTPDVSGLVTTSVLNAEVGEIENKISDVKKTFKYQKLF